MAEKSLLLDYQMSLIFLLALIIPSFWPEYYFGFVVGATYAFGAIILIVSGLVITLMVYLLYKGPRFFWSLLTKSS